MSAAPSKKSVTVLGAGVQGLTVAWLLQAQGYNVTILARDSPLGWAQDSLYTSPKAGANWMSYAALDDKRLQKWDEVTYRFLHALATLKHTTVMRLPAEEYWDDAPGVQWFSQLTPN
ncbi:hypothetical protein BDK51DRAFT_49591, partial [Blyttiomyces helicus]